MDIRLCHFEVVLDHLPLDLQELRLAEAPETAGREHLHGGRTRGGVDDGEFSEEVPPFHGLDGRAVDLDLHLPEVDDEEHAGWRPLLEDVLAHVRLVGFHGRCQLFALRFGEFEQQKVLADGGLQQLQVGSRLGVVDAADILEDLVERQSSVHLLVLQLPPPPLPLPHRHVFSQLQLLRQMRLLAPHPQPTLFSKD